MNTVLLAATVLCIVINTAEVAGKLARARAILNNAAQVGVPARWLPYLAVLEGAGVVGLVLGLLGWRTLGLAAAVGLVVFFVGAVVAHLWSRVLYNIAFPGGFLVLAVAATVYFG